MERCSYAEFKERYSWGTVAADYLRCIHGLHLAQATQDEARRIVALKEQVRSELVLSMRTKPDDQSGQNILILAAHIGVANILGYHCLPESQLPISRVARTTEPDQGSSFHVSTSAPDTVVKFLKLAKLVRKGIRRTLIFPDGGSGELSDIKVLGVPMQIGRGAAVLGYHGKAITHFICSNWEGKHLRIALETGPSPMSGETFEGFEPRLSKFYAECLESILTGPPENIGMFAHKFANLLSKERM